jgi:tripeptide aminopeptidase
MSSGVSLQPPREGVVDRFLRYVRVDTQSREDQPQIPSTPGQWVLSQMLAEELRALRASDVTVSPQAVVMATVPATSVRPDAVPVVGLIAHVDTSPAVSGASVTPIVHHDYRGGDIVLPGDPSQVIRVAEHPVLRDMIGDDIITTDGTTLLGSDDKSGVAAIMTLVDTLLLNPQILHGTVRVAFTADEEIGRGADAFDVAGFGAAYAYTVDGDVLGEISHETWGAWLATVTFHGKSAHPGSAKGVMVNAAYALADFVASCPADIRPESTEGRVGFIHPYVGSLDVERSQVKVLLRDFDVSGLEAKERLVRQLADNAAARTPGTVVEIEIREQYRNMNEVLVKHPMLTENALEAARRAGLTPATRPIRGGTDGARLTFMGLPCPNLFTGGQNFHSKLEFNSRRGLERTTETLVHLVQVFAERSSSY